MFDDAPTGEVWTVVVAAGASTRFGRPKLLEELGGRRVIDHSVAAARSSSDGVVVVTSNADVMAGLDVDHVVPGGATRSASVRAGLAAVPEQASIVLVHDAARPGADEALFRRVIDAVAAGADAVVPAVAVADTIKQVTDGRVVGTPDRSGLVAVQTPQGLDAAALRDAHASGLDATDDAGLIEAAGGTVVVVDGSLDNEKITTERDLLHAAARWDAVERPDGGDDMASSNIRIGHGFDMHRISDDPARPMILGGIHFEGVPGLVGHSDADAVTHAVIDAVLAAAGLGDIGQHFPDTDPTHSGADSMVLLDLAMADVHEAGWSVVNVDCTVIADRPKLAPRRAEMEARLSAVTGGSVTVKGKTTEQVGALGRGEAVVAQAVALVEAR